MQGLGLRVAWTNRLRATCYLQACTLTYTLALTLTWPAPLIHTLAFIPDLHPDLHP